MSEVTKKRVFLTGASGMVGKNILENINTQKFEVLTVPSSKLDLTNYNDVFDYLKTNKPDIILHCAGKVGGIQANMKDLYGFFTENLIMGVNLVKAAKELEIKRFLNLSSSCAYPREAKNPLTEKQILTGELEPTNEGYALAKLSVLKMCEYITNFYEGYMYKTLIPCNLYGRWDKFDPKHSHMIPAIIKKIYEVKINNEKQVEIWGDGTARREFMYTGELAKLIVKSIENFEILPPVMNIGLGYDYSINEYYKVVADVIGYKGNFVHDLSKPVGMKQKLLDISYQKKLGWISDLSLKSGIEKTFDFYLERCIND